MPRTSAATSKKQPLTLAQLAAYDDILTDALVDHAFYWTTIPKNRTSYHPSRGVREDEITKIIQNHLIVDPNPSVAEEKLLATDGLRKFYGSLKTPKEKQDFKGHLRRYMSIYLPDCPFEVNATNRYTIVTYEASITARRFIRRNETIKYLAGIQVTITPEEEAEMALRKKDFSLIVSSRSKATSLFMGPARFANHDCEANAKLVTCGQAGIEIKACRDIEVGEEITVTYANSYFGENNCECLCQTCEEKLANGWQARDGGVSVQKSIEGDPVAAAQGYSLRRRRRDESATGAGSRTPSVTPDIRPRIFKKQRSQRMLGERASTTDSTEPDQLGRSHSSQKRKWEALGTPPVTPAKRLKTSHYEVIPIPLPPAISRGSSDTELSRSPLSSEYGNGDMTEATSPGSEEAAPLILSPEPTPTKQGPDLIKLEESVCKTEDQEQGISTEILPTTESPSPPSETDIAVVSHPATILNVPSVECPSSATSRHSEPEQAQNSDRNTLRASGYVEPAEDGKGNTATSDAPGIEPASGAPTSRAKSRKRQAAREVSPAPGRQRIPGDYTLTPLLLSEPETAWVHCTNCNTAFVQRNAYFTKSNCPRCERHSMLYGYIWPKTAPAGPSDREERVLDHRTVHRFLRPEDEAKVRGRKHWRERLGSQRESADSEEQFEERGRARVRDGASGDMGPESAAPAGVRRSGRVRRASAKAIGE
ncbi:histone lysine methyltransferase Set9 [Madurella fahalii]|uniref:Histone-lysine N-methyltransferase SET9 n=1 Tax=Madurella fahalii TaxID=1157608 RepID=A0ABQ0GQE2_9PEZI